MMLLPRAGGTGGTGDAGDTGDTGDLRALAFARDRANHPQVADVEESGPVTALLGPTNTGKTHRAIERMLDHRTGMIGLPLRLLAREIYDRISARVGEGAVALITGEEKRVPARPRYWVCTVESMPVDRAVDFLAVDEIQLAAHRQRGHVFTDRLLHARGRIETWFLGAWTVAPLLRLLLPAIRIDSRPRFSTLTHLGEVALSSLPPRTAVVAFTTEQVYELAERLRQRRGGAAVVLGALSPRTRNAQVAMYQAGEVDYLVATDAIGMGLNMDVDHVAFAGLEKFDGRERRPLERDELAQIAGRAGRFQRDGSFGTTGGVGPLPPPVAAAIEGHRFAPLPRLIWRNSALDHRSLAALIASLRQVSPRPELQRVERADDYDALTQLATSPEIRRRADHPEAVALLWDVCRIPDFRKLMLDSHVRLLARIFAQLSGPTGRLDTDWIAAQIHRLGDSDGDLATLMARIASVRTWTYIAHHPAWLADAAHWQERTAALENELSDALHARLTERFVRRTARERGVGPRSSPAVDRTNPFLRLAALDLPPGPRAGDPGDEEGGESGGPARDGAWVERLVAAEHRAIARDGLHLRFEGDRVGRLGRGPDLLHPEVVLVDGEALGAGSRARILRRLVAWIRDEVATIVGGVGIVGSVGSDGPEAPEGGRGGVAGNRQSPALRGLLYQLSSALGTVERRAAAAQVHALRAADRRLLEDRGVVLGARAIYLRRALKAGNIERRAALVAAFYGAEAPEAPRPGAVSLAVDPAVERGLYLHLGYRVAGPRAIRVDLLEERLAELLAAAANNAEFTPPPGLASRLGIRSAELGPVLGALGFEPAGGGRYRLRPRRQDRRQDRRRR